MPLELSLAVVGLDFPNADKSNRRFEMALCFPGEPVHLVPDPKNRADPRAVAVVSARGTQLGYLTAERCGLIGARLDAGEHYEAFFQEPGRAAATFAFASAAVLPLCQQPSRARSRVRKSTGVPDRPRLTKTVPSRAGSF